MPSIRRALAPALLAAAALSAAYAVRTALACPIIAPPQTLHTLYKASERVVVARTGASETLKTKNNMALVRTVLHVSEDVKGSGAPVIELYHLDYVISGPGGKQLAPAGAGGTRADLLKQGERLLFFLDRRAAGDGYEVNDLDYGAKALSDDDLKVYLERIGELAAILAREPEDKPALVEWLVRCAEHPATRWEGAHELQQSVEGVLRLKASAGAGNPEKEEAEGAEEEGAADVEGGGEASDAEDAEADDGGPEEESEGEEAESEDDATPAGSGEAADADATMRAPTFRFTPPDPSLASLLSAGQKRRLTDALLGSQEMNEGEQALFYVVRGYGDERLPDFLLAQLRRVQDDPMYESGEWLLALVASLGDRGLTALADKYVTDGFFDSSEVEAAAGEPATPAAGQTEDEKREAMAARFRAIHERAQRRRSEALKAMLTRVEEVMAARASAPVPAEPAPKSADAGAKPVGPKSKPAASGSQ
jgi:hypothetical protein